MQAIELLKNWLLLNPSYGMLISFVVAFAESVLFIGGIIPGSFAITAIGTLAGAGIIPVMPTFLSAILGAIGGDFTSFFIGRWLKEKIKDLVIFKKYPKPLQQGELYFKKYGSKSVFFARFIGPIRAIVPAVAGMMGMKIHQFIFANILSAILWSILFFFPGVLIGKGHDVLHQYISQIAYTLLLFFILPFILVKLTYRFKYQVYPIFLPYLNFFWEKIIQKYPIFHNITPTHDKTQYHESCSEFLISLVWIILTLLCLLSRYQPDTIWSQFPLLYPYTKHFAFYAFNPVILVSLFVLSTLFCLHQNQPKIAIAFVILATVLIPLHLQNALQYTLVFTIALQYLLLRINSHHRLHHYQFLYIFFVIFWILANEFVSQNLKININFDLCLGLSLAQFTWLFLRRHVLTIKKDQLWTALMLFLPLIGTLFGILF